MKNTAVKILNERRIMAISTVRPDGWPQTTIVGYANDGLTVYFMIFRSSQKFANIARDDRVAIAVGEEPSDLEHLQAVYASALASEVTDPEQRREAWGLLSRRHPNLASFDLPEMTDAAVMRADCKHVSLLDYTKGYGHADSFTVGANGEVSDGSPRTERWGAEAAKG